jgi:hypothetical protein
MNLSGLTAYVGDMEVLLLDLRFAARVLGRSTCSYSQSAESLDLRRESGRMRLCD